MKSPHIQAGGPANHEGVPLKPILLGWESSSSKLRLELGGLVGARGFEPPTPCAQGLDARTFNDLARFVRSEIRQYLCGFLTPSLQSVQTDPTMHWAQNWAQPKLPFGEKAPSDHCAVYRRSFREENFLELFTALTSPAAVRTCRTWPRTARDRGPKTTMPARGALCLKH
jgi:hypothetical protein